MKAQSDGIPFVGFTHPFLMADEIRYKFRAAGQADAALQLEKWSRWRKQPERIVGAVRDACAPGVSGNLLEHRWGSSFAEVPANKVANLGAELFHFFLGGDLGPDAFGPRFDRLATHLRDERLGCPWPLMAYLSFIAHPQQYFPIRPTRFQNLARFYGIELELVGRVEWKRYAVLLDLAEGVGANLERYAPAGAIHLQSYMWVVAYLLEGELEEEDDDLVGVDWSDELARRLRTAGRRERLGLLGEQVVMERERNTLMAASRGDLAQRVRLVSAESRSFGYDILSFRPDGRERHIEVKATSARHDIDRGFWLSDHECRTAETDPLWVLLRVCQVDSEPDLVDLGNMVRDGAAGWVLEADSWFVRPTKASGGDS
jgi:Protein NO VEIN, C-terminal